MVISIDQNDGFVSITATGGQTDLDFDFPIYEKSHLQILRTRSGTTTALVLDNDYTIADGELEQEAGGTAVLTSGATASDVYTLLLNVPEERTTDFNDAGDFLAGTLNRELDLQTQITQQLRRDVDKSATLPDTSTLTSLELPTPQASKLIGWNSSADGMANYAATDLSGTVVTAYIETLFDDADAASARTTLGALSSSAGAVANSNLATMAANTIKANNTGSTASPSDVSMAANTVLTRAGGNITTTSLSASQLLGRGSTGDIAAITLGTGMSMSGTTLSSTGLTVSTTQATTSGTSKDFTGLPSGIKRITILMNNVSSNGTTNFLIQGIVSGTPVTSGYASSSEYGGTGATSTSGFIFTNGGAASAHSGGYTLCHLGSNLWSGFGVIRPNAATGSGGMCSGDKSFAGTLDGIRLTTVGGDTFDLGNVNIMYEL